MKRGVLILLLVLFLSFIAADSLPLYVAPLNSTGSLQPDTSFRYDINFSTGNCVSGPFVINYTEAIRTNAAGIGFLNITFTNPSETPTLICQFQNGTLKSILPFSSQFFNGVFAQTINATGNTTSNWFIGKINASFIINAPWTNLPGNSSWNQSHANSLYHSITSQLGNTTLQVFAAVDNGTFLKISQWNATNTTYRTRDNGTFTINISTISSVLADNLCYANGTNCPAAGAGDLTAIFSLNGFLNLNNTDSGDIYLNFNSTHLNITTDLRYFTKAQWNATNTSYLLIDRFNVTNASYRTLINTTFTSDIVANNLCYSNGTNCPASGTGNINGLGTAGFIPIWNATASINNSAIYQNGSSISIGTQLNLGTLFVNGTINASKIVVNNTPVMTIDQWNATNTSYLLIDRFNATNATYRADYNTSWVGALDVTGRFTFGSLSNNVINATHLSLFLINNSHINASAVNASQILAFSINASHISTSAINSSHILAAAITSGAITANAINTTHITSMTILAGDIAASAINATHLTNFLINNSHISAAAINATQIAVSGVNTTTILDNTILPIDLDSAVNETYRLRSNHTFTGNVNVTSQNITLSNPSVLNISSNGTCIMLWGSSSRFEIC